MERRTLLTGFAAVGAMTLLGCSRSDDDPAPAPSTTTPPATTPEPTVAPTAEPTAGTPTIAATIATGLNVPWGIAFLASGDALVTQRDEGTIVRIATDGTVTTLGSVPDASGSPGGEGGLLGIAIPPGDESVVFVYVTTGSDDRIVRMSLSGDELGEPEPILTGIPIGSRHHGGRLLFDPSGLLFVATGDAGNGELAQDRDSLAGKVLRIEGLAFDAEGRLWAAEFGDKSADELNLIERGGNYGWPGVEGRSDDGDLVNPKVTWGTDECSPAGIAITKSTAFIGALQGECLFAVPLDGTDAGEPKAHFAGDHGRIRSVAVAPDGALWVTTSNTDGRGNPRNEDDRIFRVTV
jgi:glucose/arabinose dehydrogenase